MSDEVKGPARVMVKAILADLKDRRGIRQAFDLLDTDMQDEIEGDLIAIVDHALSPLLSAAEERGRVKGMEILAMLESVPELNPSNYTHDEVCELNAKMTEITLAARALFSTGDGEEK